MCVNVGGWVVGCVGVMVRSCIPRNLKYLYSLHEGFREAAETKAERSFIFSSNYLKIFAKDVCQI